MSANGIPDICRRSNDMKFSDRQWLALPVLVFALGLYGCEAEGPAERAGEEVDQAVEQAGDTAERAGERVEEATENR
jgi:hypothetical protein